MTAPAARGVLNVHTIADDFVAHHAFERNE